ncbi:MAG: hypothetical protein RMK84_14035 [Oscillochloridaceae bacterium]|nr:hypothetical protein [Chloroflexaceae bacterium]MDW8391240.1 hypothetical protein [Oscillochloridaceae bacterium]
MDNTGQVLQRLAAGVERAGLRAPVALLLDILSPIDVISSQVARFSLPFLGGTRAEVYVAALGEPDAWRDLRRLLDAR